MNCLLNGKNKKMTSISSILIMIIKPLLVFTGMTAGKLSKTLQRRSLSSNSALNEFTFYDEAMKLDRSV